MRIGIIGGAFDPITKGHLRVGHGLVTANPETRSESDYIGSGARLDEVWYMPCWISYYGKKMAPARDRLEMCRLALKDYGDPHLKVCDYEVRNQSTGDSEHIWDELMAEYNERSDNGAPENTFYFIIGMDNANKIRSWGNLETLVKKIAFCIVPRTGYSEQSTEWYQEGPHIILRDYQPDDISSTQVRSEREGSGLITPEVQRYILQNRLYEDISKN